MRTQILTIILIGLALHAYGQATKNETGLYLPDRKPIPLTQKTFGQINKEFEEGGRVYLHTIQQIVDKDTSYGMVVFKLFTDTPLYISTKYPSKINEMIKSFDLNEFFRSWKFESELQSYIKKGTLSDIFILQTLGRPNNKASYFDKDRGELSSWVYSRLNITLLLKDGIVISYLKSD
ncbi:MAG: hypothetical protein WCE64_07905 [Bacteroidales bacterium]